MSGYLLRPCKSTAAYEALPDTSGGNLNLDLDSVQIQLLEIDFELVCDAKVMIILKKGIEVTIYPSGKLLLKTDIKDDAERIMNEIYSKIIE
jgi:hypothetical protein